MRELELKVRLTNKFADLRRPTRIWGRNLPVMAVAVSPSRTSVPHDSPAITCRAMQAAAPHQQAMCTFTHALPRLSLITFYTLPQTRPKTRVKQLKQITGGRCDHMRSHGRARPLNFTFTPYKYSQDHHLLASAILLSNLSTFRTAIYHAQHD